MTDQPLPPPPGQPPDPPIPPDGKPPTDTTGFAQYFTDSAFWQKAKDVAGKVGRGTMQKAMEIYHVAMSPDTPVWAKAVAVGSLGYLIFPVDAIPDFIPVAGLTDDAAALAAAATAIMGSITPAIKAKAAEQVSRWFGPNPSAPPTAGPTPDAPPAG